MNQSDLSRKRAKRQSSRKEAQARARRRDADARGVRAKHLAELQKPKLAPSSPGFLGKLLGVTLGGTPVANDQSDSEAATIISGSEL